MHYANTIFRLKFFIVALFVITSFKQTETILNAQTISNASAGERDAQQSLVNRYIDTKNGMTATEAVAYAIAHNGELQAARSELEAARAFVKQAGLRSNPKLEMQRRQQLGGSDNDTMIGGSLPLELGGRRAARISVAERELEVKEFLLTDRERRLAAEVRAKFGEALASVLKLGFTEDLLETTARGYKLVMARVTEGRTAPLEENMVLVEVNRFRSMRESDAGRVEVSLLELRNLIGMKTEEPLHLRGDFDALIETLPPLNEATMRALRERPDLQAARATENLAEANIEQARATGRLDAELTGQYERNNFSFPQRAFNDAGQLVPIHGVFHSVAVGITFDLPVRNKNQGAIEAAIAQAEAAKRRREFYELTVRREVAAGYAKYERAARAMEIYRAGVRDQSNRNLDVVRQTYELGSKTLVDYLAEQRRYIETENGFIDALLATYQARIEIESSAAEPELIK